MRNIFANELAKYGLKNKKIYMIVADISPAGPMLQFQKKNPGRFINVGVAEQSMIGISAGIAMEGGIAFAYTIATFALYRPFEMIRNDLCYQNLPVTIVGMGSGSVYHNLGATHITQEDVSIARSIPNMQVLSPCDPYELKMSLKYCINNKKGPIYLKLGKSGEKNYNFKESEKWKFGKIRRIKNGKSHAILCFGPIIDKANNILEKLKKKKINSSLYSCHTLKPFDSKTLLKLFKKYKTITIIEDHSEIGGLTSIVKNIGFGINIKCKINSFSLKDKFYKSYGSRENFWKKHGIEEKKIIKKILKNEC